MPITRTSLIVRLRAGADPTAWPEFLQLYEPFLRAVVRRAGIPEQDVADVVQNVLLRLIRALPGFEYAPERGRFRAWLCSVCRSAVADWRRRQLRLRAQALMADVVAPPAPELRSWEEEHRRHVLRHALMCVRRQISDSAWSCFERYVLEQHSAREVAAQCALTPAAVYVVVSRVRARLRQKCAQFDEDFA